MKNTPLRSAKGFQAFSNYFRAGKKFSTTRILVSIAPRKAQSNTEEGNFSASPCVYFGVSAKRRTRPAALRNRIKRLLRESLRLLFKERQERGNQFQFESVILIWNDIPKKVSLLSLHDVFPVVQEILESAEKYFEEKNLKYLKKK